MLHYLFEIGLILFIVGSLCVTLFNCLHIRKVYASWINVGNGLQGRTALVNNEHILNDNY